MFIISGYELDINSLSDSYKLLNELDICSNFEDSVIETLLADPEPNLALVDKYENWMDGTCLILGQNDEIKDFVPGSEFCFANKDKYYKTVNIYKFSKEFPPIYRFCAKNFDILSNASEREFMLVA